MVYYKNISLHNLINLMTQLFCIFFVILAFFVNIDKSFANAENERTLISQTAQILGAHSGCIAIQTSDMNDEEMAKKENEINQNKQSFGVVTTYMHSLMMNNMNFTGEYIFLFADSYNQYFEQAYSGYINCESAKTAFDDIAQQYEEKITKQQEILQNR